MAAFPEPSAPGPAPQPEAGIAPNVPPPLPSIPTPAADLAPIPVPEVGPAPSPAPTPIPEPTPGPLLLLGRGHPVASVEIIGQPVKESGPIGALHLAEVIRYRDETKPTSWATIPKAKASFTVTTDSSPRRVSGTRRPKNTSPPARSDITSRSRRRRIRASTSSSRTKNTRGCARHCELPPTLVYGTDPVGGFPHRDLSEDLRRVRCIESPRISTHHYDQGRPRRVRSRDRGVAEPAERSKTVASGGSRCVQ